jgi:hypothetical protein
MERFRGRWVRTDRLVDANAILFVTGGEEFLETRPVRSVGYGSAILTALYLWRRDALMLMAAHVATDLYGFLTAR